MLAIGSTYVETDVSTNEDGLASRFVELSHSCGDLHGFRLELIRELGRHLAFDAALFVPSVDAMDAAPMLVSLGCEPAMLRPYLQGFGRHTVELAAGPTGARRQTARARTGYYADVGPAGTTWMSVDLPTFHGSSPAALSLFRLRETQPFGQPDLARLCQLLPLLTLADVAAQAMTLVENPQVPLRDRRLEEFREAFETLTPRERQVARYLGMGLQNKEIAAVTGTSPSTVRKQTIQIYAKTRCGGRAEVGILVRLAGYAASDGDS